MVWSREFRFPHVTRRFDAIMKYSQERGCIVDWLGGSGRLEVELYAVLIDRGIQIESRQQWLRLGRASVPLPRWIAGKATIREWLDEHEQLRISVVIQNPLLGDFFGYEGSFVEVAQDESPAPALPIPEPAEVVPVLKWLALAALAIVGTVLIAWSFTWNGPPLLRDTGAAIGVGSGIAWLGFGVALLTTGRRSTVAASQACIFCGAT